MYIRVMIIHKGEINPSAVPTHTQTIIDNSIIRSLLVTAHRVDKTSFQRFSNDL